ncbi:hypothetical protein ACXWTF_11735 [Thiomicrolovo sp. ZZH C-3]
MKRTLMILTGFVVLIAILLILPFTPPGNRIIAGIVQEKLNEALPLPTDVEQFDLGFRRFSVVILLDRAGRIEAEGEYSLFDRSLAAGYRADLTDLASLSSQKMQGSLQTEGTVTGTLPLLEIAGHTDAAGGDTNYRLTLDAFNPGALTATVRHARLEQLLSLLGQAPLASGSIDAEILLHSIDPAALDGTVDAVLAQGVLNRQLIHSTYGVQLPDAALNATLKARLNADTVTYDARTDSALGRFTSEGTLTPQNGGMDIRYAFAIKELALLGGLRGKTLHGPVALAGALKGDREHLDATASGELAGGKGTLKAVLKAYTPVSADVTAQHLRLARLLSMFGYPRIADADVSGKATMPSLEPGALKGTVAVEMNQGRADADALSKLLGRPFPASAFTLKTQSRLAGESVTTVADFVSDLFILRSDTLEYNVKQKRLKAAYTANVPDLSRLSTLAERPLRGTAKITGDLTYDDALLLHANSSLLKGTIAATLKAQTLHADFKQVSTAAALHMLVQPETFDARFDGTLDYRLDDKKGELKGALSEGAFSRNNAFDLLRQYSSVDLYKERFDGTTLARLDDTKIDADVRLRSDRATLQSTHAKIDTAADTLRADVKLEAAGAVIPFRLKGKISRPGVTIDARKLIEQEAGKQVQQLFDSLFK